MTTQFRIRREVATKFRKTYMLCEVCKPKIQILYEGYPYFFLQEINQFPKPSYWFSWKLLRELVSEFVSCVIRDKQQHVYY